MNRTSFSCTAVEVLVCTLLTFSFVARYNDSRRFYHEQRGCDVARRFLLLGSDAAVGLGGSSRDARERTLCA